MRVSYPQKNNFATLTANLLNVATIDNPSGELNMKSGGEFAMVYTGSYINCYDHLRLITAKKIVDQELNTLLDPDDAGGITTLANVASATTFNSVTVQQPFLKGIANKEFVPCVFLGDLTNVGIEFENSPAGIRNIGPQDVVLAYQLMLPLTAYGLSLWIDDLRVNLYDTDVNNYIDRVDVYGITGLTQTQLAFNLDNQDNIELKVVALDAVDVSAYPAIIILLTTSMQTAEFFGMNSVSIEAYYDAP